MKSSIFVVFVLLSFVPLIFSMRVARQPASISLSLEYLGNCKQFDVDYHTLWVSSFVDGGCLPINPDQTDRNDITSYTHICVRINDKKSIINFVGLPPTYALSFIPTNPFKTLKQQTLIRRPNCGVKQQYMSNKTEVVECKDNQVELNTEYVVSDDRIYIFPAASNVSTCSISGGCCPYINTIPNGGICPNTQPAGKLNLYFLPKHQEHHHEEEEHRGEEYIPKFKLFKDEQHYEEDQHNYSHKKKEAEDKKDAKKDVSTKDAKKKPFLQSNKKKQQNPSKVATFNVVEVNPKNGKQDKSLGKSVKVEVKEVDEIEEADDNVFSKKSLNNVSGGHRHIGQAIKPTTQSNVAPVKVSAQASAVSSSKSVSSTKSVSAQASAASNSVSSASSKNTVSSKPSKQSGGSSNFHASFPSDDSSHSTSPSSSSSSTYTSQTPSSNFPLPVDDTKDTDNVSFEDVYDDEPAQPSHSSHNNKDHPNKHTQPNKMGNPSTQHHANDESQDDDEDEEFTPPHQSHSSHTILSNKNSAHKNPNNAASKSSNKNVHQGNTIPSDEFDEVEEEDEVSSHPISNSKPSKSSSQSAPASEESDDFIPDDDIFSSNRQTSKKSDHKAFKVASIKKH